ncbi:MAG TPA: MBL fold metallo-hydrolase [Firmicutes bacterium]|nr:MBL fold metallo-hydrolase [Candidatus Fermentithermobacillaceae bacterium]
MKLRVLGKYSPFPRAGGACPGYWIHTEKTGVLLECGPGVLSRFQQYEHLGAISVVVLSHLHADHSSDFLSLRYATESARRYPALPAHLTVYAPEQPVEVRETLKFKDKVVVEIINPGKDVRIGDLTITFFKVEHPFECYAMRIDDGRTVLTYSGDTRPCDALICAAREAHLFLCESSCLERDASFAAAGHLTARQAAEAAREAGVRKLLLTHIWPFYSEAELLAEASEVFQPVAVAAEGTEYEV